MKTSYKFWYIKKEDDVHISEVAVRFYEGDNFDVNVVRVDPETLERRTELENRYIRTKRLSLKDVPHEKERKVVTESNGNECFVYTPDDFGVTSDIDDVVVFLNGVLKKDKKRVPEDTQKETVKGKLKLQSIK